VKRKGLSKKLITWPSADLPGNGKDPIPGESAVEVGLPDYRHNLCFEDIAGGSLKNLGIFRKPWRRSDVDPQSKNW
jgi:hypothetical protein